jgi:hypothetical protein
MQASMRIRCWKVPEGEFDFLGYSFGRMYSARTGQARLGYRPSRKSIRRMVENIHALTARSERLLDPSPEFDPGSKMVMFDIVLFKG